MAVDGHVVVAVDESIERLKRVQGAKTVHPRIETLALDRRFDLVLLLSHLGNADGTDALLARAARHVAVDGLVLLQRLAPRRSWEGAATQLGHVTLALEAVSLDGRSVSATSVYTLGGRVWRRRWTLHERTDDELARALGPRLEPIRLDGAWVLVRPRQSLEQTE